jgi:hypothetical protein
LNAPTALQVTHESAAGDVRPRNAFRSGCSIRTRHKVGGSLEANNNKVRFQVFHEIVLQNNVSFKVTRRRSCNNIPRLPCFTA